MLVWLRLWLNGKEEPITERFKTCLRELRRMAGDRVVDGVTVVTKGEWADYHVRVVSVNTFPTAGEFMHLQFACDCMDLL